MLLSIALVIVGGVLALAGSPADESRLSLERHPLPPGEGLRVWLEVLVDGRPLPTIWHEGRIYLPVPKLGTEYELRVWNHGPRRITAIVAVDGLSVISGQSASEADPGYIVAPGSSIQIKGWRRNLDTVAAFRFTEREDSYAYRMGRAENIGVIGLIAIEEMHRWPPLLRDYQARPALGAKRAAEVGGTGTGYGRDVDSPIVLVPFVRSANKRTITIYYDTVDALRRAGVPVEGRFPTPFPGDLKFAPPPPGYPEK
jgi:hypothetical protein